MSAAAPRGTICPLNRHDSCLRRVMILVTIADRVGRIA